jgi:hypothetical protein
MRLDVGGKRGLALMLLASVWCGSAWAETTISPPPGHLRTLTAHPVVVPPVIDGVPNDPAWDLGSTAEGFWISDTQRPPTDQTRVIVVYDDKALYFAITCFDSRPDLIRATQITRDSAPGLDDRITVELDPYHNHRSVSRFTVTARGTQSDTLAGGRARKLEWKGVWTAATMRTPTGWTAEVAIPLDMLEFDPDADTFGINFNRYQNRTREWSEWANLTPQRLPEEAGHLTGLRLPQAGVPGRLDVMQYVSGAVSATEQGQADTGVDVRYQWRGAMTSVVSARPDFSGIDADVPGVGFSYTEKFVTDHRPFFQEGGAFFGDREIFHSGRVEQFDLGVKTFGRVDGYQVGVLATADAASGRADYVGRVVREIGPTFNLSATMAATDRETLDNHALQLQAGGRLGRNVRVDGNIARTSGGRPSDGMRRRGEIAYQGSPWYAGGWADQTDPEYFPANGFIADDVIGTEGRGAFGGYNRAFAGDGIRRVDASASFDVRDTTSGLRQRQTTSIYAGAETATNIQLNAGMTVGTYRPRNGAAPGQWMDVLNDDRFYLASAFYQSPTGQFGYGAQYSWGFVGVKEYDSIAPSIWLAPNSHFSLAYSFERATHDRTQEQHVVSGTWDITGAQSLNARWVEYDGGYYRVSYRRMLAHGVDAFGVYTSDPYAPGRVNVKLVWTLSPFQRR